MSTSQVVLITGAGSGIGRCFAETLAAAGNDLVLLDVDARGLAATAAALDGKGGKTATAVVDVADRAALEKTVADLVAPRGRLDLLINCAAILGPGTWAAQAPEDFERVLRVDLVGTANVIRTTLPWLRAARGQIVNLASTAALHGWPGLAAYSGAKFAVTGFSEAIRPELALDGVGLTVVFPLLIDTPLLSAPDIPPILRHGRRIPAAAVVRKALRAAERRRRRVYVPGTVRVIAALHGLAPSLLDWYGKRFGMERGGPR
jgi:NAD(P)-dependent dehydrogenase (short-subunit alcohol dehydrogenase family)